VINESETRSYFLWARTVLRARAERIGILIDRRPLALVAVLASALQAYAAYRVYAPLSAGEWPRLRDSMIFEYVGWRLARGERLYVDVWEIKPPLAFEVTGGLALLSGGNVTLYHVLALLATSGALVGSAVLAAAIVEELTGDSPGAVIGGLTVFVLPAYFWRALIGFKSKYFVILFGFLLVWLLLRDRPALAGVAGAAAVGFWQMAIVFPVVGFGWVLQEGNRSDLRRFVAGGIGASAIILVPVAIWGALPAMLAEAVLTPLLITERTTPGENLRFALSLLGKSLPVALVGIAGYAGSLTRSRRGREWPLLVVLGWFTAVVLFFDLDFYPDLFPWFAVIGIGVGLAVGHGSDYSSRALGVAMASLVVLSVATMGGFGAGGTGVPATGSFDTTMDLDPNPPYNGTEAQYLFWTGEDAESCRLFAGWTQARLIRQANLSDPGEPRWEVPCGRLSPVWEAFVEKYS
jgi:hypothetical protein